ncbi:5-formyltetrahydrofolate cyclo-ligase [Candidatus Berkelbacteria bacterium]|nr:5-formyltetrahydrofolate cyclo-ligase [Candidatus Berkelbacteria bacterium]
MLTKSQLRINLRASRDRLRASEVNRRSAKIQHQLLKLPEIRNSRTLHVYVAVRQEVETRALIESLWSQGKTVLVPVLSGANELESFPLADWSEIEINGYGRCSPIGGGRYTGPIDAIIVPGLAYTERGDRLGSGYGHYDRFLTAHSGAVSIAPAYQIQLLSEIPNEAHDQQMDVIVTEDRVIRTQHNDAP